MHQARSLQEATIDTENSKKVMDKMVERYWIICPLWNDTFIIMPDDPPSLWRDAITAQIKEKI